MVNKSVFTDRSSLGIVNSRLRLMVLGALIVGFAGCGGGGGGGSGSSGGGNGGSGASFTISGTVSGLATGQQVSLLNNADVANAATVTADGAFTFNVSVPSNGSYAVTVGTQPAGQACTVGNGSGSGVTANVVGISVTCTTNTPGSVAPHTGWATVKMGGGGYIPGIIYHPTVANLRYARTDMDGVYRWDNSISKWTALTDGFAPEDGGNEGAESMAVDPTDPNKLYMTTSMSVSWGNGRFYYSSNQGNTWNYVTLPFPIGSNNNGRGIGERLMVDPNLPATMFYASRTAGLWKSTDSGLHWNQVTSLSSKLMSTTDMNNANGGSPIGVEFVVFGTTVPTTGFAPSGASTPTIYVGVAPDYQGLAGLSSNLYKSTDGGATWAGITIPSAVTNEITSKDLHIPHLVRAADGMLYVPFTTGAGPGSGAQSFLYKFDDSTTSWTQLIRTTNGQPGVGSYYGGIGGLSVYGSGATTKIAFGVSGTWGSAAWVQIAMASDDAGKTWHEIGRSGDLDGSLNYHDVGGYWGWTDTLQIDPFNPNHVSYGLGGGIMSSVDAFSASGWKPHWTYDVDGIEERVNLGMVAPPPGAAYVLGSAHGDTGLDVHTSLTTSPNRAPSFGGNGTGIDMAWNNPAFIVAVGGYGTSKGAYSNNSGLTWTNFLSAPPTATATGDHSKVAVTADGANIIWSVAGEIPYYSTNNGATWTATNLPAPMAAYNASYHIAADRKNPLKVYAYDHGGDFWNPLGSGKFYTSKDGGHSFTASAQTWDPLSFNTTDMAVNPFAEGDIWLADGNNLWHSLDSGATWTKLSGTLMGTANPNQAGALPHGAMKVALGVAATGSNYSAAVYFVGRLLTNGVYVYGVYRSDDAGVHWTRIDDDNHRYGGVGAIVADASVYGRVFMAGRGIDYNY